MPRKIPPPRKAYPALTALRLQSSRREAVAARRDHHAREAALALRKATPDWVELEAQLKRYQLEAEMDAMEACLEAQKPDIPILNFDLMPGFEPPNTSQVMISKGGTPKPEPEEHPDVAEARRLAKLEAEIKRAQETSPRESVASNENSPPPHPSHLGGKNWKYDSIAGGYDPADDWRNWE